MQSQPGNPVGGVQTAPDFVHVACPPAHESVTSPAPWLSGQHTIFGQCDNLPLLEKLSRLETLSNDAPKTPVAIQRVLFSRKNK